MNKQPKIFAQSRITRGRACVLAALLVVTTTVNRVEAASGDLDTTFGHGGMVTTRLGNNEFAQCVAIQPDGRIVIGLNSWYPTGPDFILVRYNADGTLDSSFGIGGVVQTYFLGYGGVVSSVKIDSRGRIVAAGHILTSPQANPPSDFALARYTASGALDTSFGLQGKVIRDNSHDDWLREIVIQKDGKIVAAGSSSTTQHRLDFAVFRLTANGFQDLTFADGNVVLTDFYDGFDLGIAAVLQSDGRIVVGGRATGNNDQGDFALARYNTNGTLDATFGGHGRVTTRISSDSDTVFDLLIRSTPFGGEQLIAVGTRAEDHSNYSDFAMACYLSDGSLNASFGFAGFVITDLSGDWDEASCAVQQPDGKIIVAGSGLGNFELARYNSNGTLDTSFGQGGKVVTIFGHRINGLALTSQGGIIAAGGGYEIALAKYLP